VKGRKRGGTGFLSLAGGKRERDDLMCRRPKRRSSFVPLREEGEKKKSESLGKVVKILDIQSEGG